MTCGKKGFDVKISEKRLFYFFFKKRGERSINLLNEGLRKNWAKKNFLEEMVNNDEKRRRNKPKRNPKKEEGKKKNVSGTFSQSIIHHLVPYFSSSDRVRFDNNLL